MLNDPYGVSYRFTICLPVSAAMCLAGGLLLALQTQVDGRDRRPAAQAA
jgi:hypothetical protein